MNIGKTTLAGVAMLLLMLSGTGPASATDQSEAVKLCAKNPACGITRGSGGVSIQIEGSSGGGGYNAEIYCPDKGECVCVVCPRVATNTGLLGTILGTKRSSPGSAPASLSEGTDGGSAPAAGAPTAPTPPDTSDDGSDGPVIL